MHIESVSAGMEAWARTGCNPWGSHIPLLRMAGGSRKVLELGMGNFSTPLFLDRTAYPFLEKLVSVDSDPGWAGSAATNDPRHEVHLVPEPIEPFLAGLDLEEFDLIFVDSSDKKEPRMETLRHLSTRNLIHPAVAVHDWETYQGLLTGFHFGILDDRQLPWTLLAWGRHP